MMLERSCGGCRLSDALPTTPCKPLSRLYILYDFDYIGVMALFCIVTGHVATELALQDLGGSLQC